MNTASFCLHGVLLVALTGCTMKVNRVDMDTSRLVAAKQVTLRCAYRLGDVIDARPAGDRAGGLSSHMFIFDDAADAVRRSLEASGFVSTDVQADVVFVRILRLYLSQSHVTKIPVVVYEVNVGGTTPFLIRSQPANMNWNGTENEAYDAFARAIAGANHQLINRLNADCGQRS